MIRITEHELLHLLEVSHGRNITIYFVRVRVFLARSNGAWVWEEIAKLRGLTPVAPDRAEARDGDGAGDTRATGEHDG